jgi:hypothetical protein
VTAYLGKLLIHPVPVPALHELWERAAIGPIPGQIVLLAGFIFHGTWIAIAILTLTKRRGGGRARPPRPERNALLELARGED